MRSTLCIALFIAFVVAPARAEPPETLPEAGKRIGGDEHDDRVGKRIPSRLPMRIETRVTARTIGKPLVAATSQITTDQENGCAKKADAGASRVCGQPQ